MNGVFIVTFIIVALFLSKIFIALWVYNDGKLRDNNALIWMMLILFFSGSLAFLLYFLVVRKESKVRCSNCNYLQSDKLAYCGRCGSQIEISTSRNVEIEEKERANRKYLIIGIGLILVAMIAGMFYTKEVLFSEGSSDSKLAIMSVSNKIGNKWSDSFKYKNGFQSHTFKVTEDKNKLNINWNLKKGEVEGKLLHKDKLIGEYNSKNDMNLDLYEDLSDYIGESVLLE